ncbi:MAG: TetR family transcriptional regulator [Pseudonocardiales bacterium]|nr:TetR/AcrR family transcriptional regulator [Actinomycetota bacterium]PZS23286.1 MAG: TetR family transcriptional regulator [Pseudonocardiales bacterium]
MGDLSTGATRDRIIDAAMELFSEHGYRGTSITRIEQAAGLSPGAGGIYHHFRSKEALLTAGVERQLSRLTALRDIRRLFADLGDLHTELTIVARYVLTELDQEAQLLRLLASEARHGPRILTDAVAQVVDLTHREFAEWIIDRSGSGVSTQQADAIATIGLGALISARLLPNLLGTAHGKVDDHSIVETWVSALEHLLTTAKTNVSA